MNFFSKSIKLFVFVFFLLASIVFPETYYVKPDGDNYAVGTSWQTAFKTITKALNTAKADDNIWVKEGTYHVGNTITIFNNISVCGGFAGTETSLEERIISEHPTIIDGENDYQCVYIYWGTIDGFHITNGKSYGYDGGGIHSHYGVITNCISWKNEHRDILGDGESISFSCYGEAREKNGNIRTNPLFMNTSGDPSTWDFHMQNGSPCIDAGTLENAPEEDMEDNPRPGTEGKICMGAYESPDYYSPLPPAPPSRIYVSKIGNNTNGDSWKDAFTSLTTTLSSIGDNFYEIWVKEGIYQEGETVFIPGRVNLYGGFAGTESSLEQRHISEHPAIIDGQETKRCVDNYGNIDGFHTTHGYGSWSGGIYNFHGIVSNCTIYSNSASLDGGGIYNYYGTVSNCTLTSNSADMFGGGIEQREGIVINCTLNSNRARKGGGIINRSGITTNCLLSYNSSNSSWGIYNKDGSVYNCTLYNNKGGIYTYNSGNVMNCISWKNGETDIQGGDVSYSCFKEAYGSYGYENINADPLFIKLDGNLSSWIYQLKNGSPCIDAGYPDESYNDGCFPPGEGTARCDMGAYGGPYNCNWNNLVKIEKSDLIDFLTGKKTLSDKELPFADRNSDDKVDIADLIDLILSLP